MVMRKDHTMKNTKRTASTDYARKTAIAEDLLKRVVTRLSEHKAKQAAQPFDWGFTGDLGCVNEQLAHVLAALGDRTGVEELGLRY